MPESIKRLPPKQCLPKMISYLSHKYGSSKPHDQIVAIAASECGVSRKNDLGLDAGIRAALHLAHYKEKYPHLSLHENLAKAYHKIMMIDTTVDFIIDNGQHGTMDEVLFQASKEFDMVHDSFDELLAWVQANIETDDPKSVAFAIMNSRKKKESKEETTEEKETSWKEAWAQIGGEFEKRRKARKGDFTTDAAPKSASYRAPRAGTPPAMVGGAKRTTVGQLLKKQGIPLTVSGPESITLPFKVVNTETGELIQGEVLENLDKGYAQMQPVSSSNVRSVGQAQNELVVAFNSTGEGSFYRFKFATPEMASEARHALIDSPSPGRWIWHNIRGHVAGEPVKSTKIGPSITSGKPTIGGTSASLVQYRTTPVAPSRVKGYKEAHEKLLRETSNPNPDPSTGARIEGMLGARKGFRELGRKIRQDHTCDFTMEGLLTRSGEFDYRAEGQGIKTKTPENLKWIAENTDHVPAFGRREKGSHKESEFSLIGFAHNFKFIPIGEVDDHAHISGEVELFKNIKDLSGLDDPRELPVSFGFDDIGEGGVQDIIRLRHLAISLDKLERDRCSTMNGSACTISPKERRDMKPKLIIKPLPKIIVSLKK